MKDILVRREYLTHDAEALRATTKDHAAMVATLSDFRSQAEIVKENTDSFTDEQWAEVAANTITKLVIGEEIEVEWAFGGRTVLNGLTRCCWE